MKMIINATLAFQKVIPPQAGGSEPGRLLRTEARKLLKPPGHQGTSELRGVRT